MIELSDEDLLARLRNYEDHFVERKLFSDSRDWLKTAVAFANTLQIGYPGVMFVGVKNDGTPEDRQVDLEQVQRSVSQQINKAYPQIQHFHRVLRHETGRQILAVIIPGSPERPHFSGQAYVRVGSDSLPASERQFQTLIAQRNSKARTILQWVGKEVTIAHLSPGMAGSYSESFSSGKTLVADCNQHYCTLREGTGGAPETLRSIPLNRVEIGFDHKRDRLQIYFYYNR